jgi:hypothetical protein
MPTKRGQLATNATNTDLADTVSINVPLPAGLHRQLRMKALMDGITLRDAVAAAVEEWVA